MIGGDLKLGERVSLVVEPPHKKPDNPRPIVMGFAECDFLPLITESTTVSSSMIFVQLQYYILLRRGL